MRSLYLRGSSARPSGLMQRLALWGGRFARVVDGIHYAPQRRFAFGA